MTAFARTMRPSLQFDAAGPRHSRRGCALTGDFRCTSPPRSSIASTRTSESGRSRRPDKAALEVIAEDRNHLAAGERLGTVVQIARQRIDDGHDPRIGDMRGDEFGERPLHPFERRRTLFPGRRAGRPSSPACRECRCGLFPSNTCRRRSRGFPRTSPSRLPRCRDISRRSLRVSRQSRGGSSRPFRGDVGMIDAPPFDAVGDAEPVQKAEQRPAFPDAGEVVRAGVEAIDARACRRGAPCADNDGNSRRPARAGRTRRRDGRRRRAGRPR